MDPRLYECALVGDMFRLRQLISGDEHILERSETANSNGNNILHIAAIYGHVHFAREVLSAKPELSSDLNEAGFSPLHLAAAKGHLGIVKLLLAVDPDLSCLKDKHGRLPAHTAAMKGRVDVLNEIMSVNPWCLQEKTDRGETVLHLSVKENRIGVVEFLMSLQEVKNMVNEEDCCGNTALHLAAARNRREVTRILISNSHVDLNASNKYNVTPRELLNRPLTRGTGSEDDEMVKLLSPSDASVSIEPAVAPSHNPASIVPAPTDHSIEAKTGRAWKARAKLADNTIIVAILIATVTFQAALTPPGGFWQDDSADLTMKTCKGTAGTAVLCATTYDQFMRFDSAAFLSSLFVIFFLVLLKSAVFPERIMLAGLILNIVLAIVYLVLAFYYAIKATKPSGSDTSEIFLKQLMWLCIGYFGGLLLLSPCIIAATYFKRKLCSPGT
ncbi:ankyrin repeat-containing protein At5g02620-like [Nymphaea colorata]|nr:ankyrin repeat-containing protein At5g02620-like [Nymphaea colorata]